MLICAAGHQTQNSNFVLANPLIESLPACVCVSALDTQRQDYDFTSRVRLLNEQRGYVCLPDLTISLSVCLAVP